MQEKEYADALNSTINWLEEEQGNKRALLNERFRESYESLKPVNLIKSTIKDLTESSTSMNDLLGPLLGLAAGQLTKRIVVGKSDDETHKVVGAALQVGVTNLVIQNQDSIISAGRVAWRFVFGRRKPREAASEE